MLKLRKYLRNYSREKERDREKLRKTLIKRFNLMLIYLYRFAMLLNENANFSFLY